MNVTGIIAEYNPFHNGHLYHLQEARSSSGADYIVVVMSPDFVQRGAPALLDKWSRAHMALLAGADLVLELPVRSALGSAEYFAQGGIRLLDSLGVVDALSFGCETGTSSVLEEYAYFQCEEEPEEFRVLLQQKLREGMSFAKARCEAYLMLRHRNRPHHGDRGAEEASLSEILRAPNNILAVEYLKAMRKNGSRMQAVPILRTGPGYHDVDSENSLASAEGIRQALFRGLDVSAQIPPGAYRILKEELDAGRCLTPADLNLPLHLKLIECMDSLEDYLDVSQDLANRIRKHLPEYTGFEQFASLLKTKQIAHTRITRSLVHILLEIRKVGCLEVSTQRPPCVRVLGFRRSAQPLLTRIKECSDTLLITKLPPDHEIPDSLSEDLRASQLWELLISHKTGRPARKERQRKILIMM